MLKDTVCGMTGSMFCSWSLGGEQDKSNCLSWKSGRAWDASKIDNASLRHPLTSPLNLSLVHTPQCVCWFPEIYMASQSHLVSNICVVPRLVVGLAGTMRGGDCVMNDSPTPLSVNRGICILSWPCCRLCHLVNCKVITYSTHESQPYSVQLHQIGHHLPKSSEILTKTLNFRAKAGHIEFRCDFLTSPELTMTKLCPSPSPSLAFSSSPTKSIHESLPKSYVSLPYEEL
jgi:hypothetical protein